MPHPRITLFKWGYEGWGNATAELVRSIDAIERGRGFAAPLFVDIRFSRGVRAIGFRDKAFERQLGHARYRWMRSLGNSAIASGGRKVRIHCPDAVQQLLDLALDASREGKRVLFFCSCGSPHAAWWCHRTEVARLLAQNGKQRGVRVVIEEWPGGEPTRSVAHRLRVDRAALRSVRSGATSIALGARRASTKLKSLPWGALVELVAPGESQLIAAGPAFLRAKAWHLPVFVNARAGNRSGPLAREAARYRRELKIDPLRS